MRISILGSCVSRDVFNDAPYGEFDVAAYWARTSIGSLFAEIPVKDVYTPKIKSTFQRRMVFADIRKQTKDTVVDGDMDVILVDLVDERFHLLESRPGARFTLSNELRSVLGDDLRKFRMIASGSPEFLKHWEDGWTKLVEAWKGRGVLERVMVNKVYWQPATVGGVPFHGEPWEQTNDVLATMYERQAKDLHATQFLEYGDLLTCPDDHQWGAAPFHFSNESHAFAREKIRAFVRREISPAHHREPPYSLVPAVSPA
jgi:hypothetical protein